MISSNKCFLAPVRVPFTDWEPHTAEGSLHTATIRDVRLGTMVTLLLSSLDWQEYSPSSSARIPVMVRVRLVPSSRSWKRLLGLISTPFLLHVTFPLAWLSSQLRDTLPPISAFTASSFLANFTGISEIQERGKLREG